MHTRPRRSAGLSLPLILFVALYMIGCTIAALRQGNTEFLMYALAMVVNIALVLLVHARVHLTATALWLLAIWGALHMLGGTVPIPDRYVLGDGHPVLYSLRLHPDLPRYDQLTHAFGFFSATVLCWESMRVLVGARSRIALSVCAAIMGMGLGAVNEVIEFAATRVTETNVGGYVNTGWDLVSNTVGAVVAGVWCVGRRVPRGGGDYT
jgi:putative membrane protein